MESKEASQVITAPHSGGYSVFLEGPAGAGKTTAAVRRLEHLLHEGVPGDAILVLTPQRTLAEPYQRFLRSQDAPGGSEVTLATLGGLARRAIDLLWPLIAEDAGFRAAERPVFLTLETAQYHMDQVLAPFLEKRYFDSVAIRRNRLASQVIDNLNKAAVVGFPHQEIAARLSQAWTGDPGQPRVYEQVQECASAFRARCLENNLLDFSLQIETLVRHVLPTPEGQSFLFQRYHHLIADNVEEDVPVAHELVARWLALAESATLVYDWDAGYRAFLGADPQSAYELRKSCRRVIWMERCLVASEELQDLGTRLAPRLRRSASLPAGRGRQALVYASFRFHPQMLDWVADQVSRLVTEQGAPPREVAIVAPYLSDALRFALALRLERYGINTVSHRPSRSLREEEGTRCLLTLTALAHPDWGLAPGPFDVTRMLVQAIDSLDVVRAQQLSRIVYRVRDGRPALTAFQEIAGEAQERITFLLGGRYDELLGWLEAYRQGGASSLDHFISRLFADVLSQAGFGFHRDLDAARVTANLVESFFKFRRAFPRDADQAQIGREYLRMVQQGVVAAQYIEDWQLDGDGVLLAPAYTFLMRNRAADYQFWLDAGSRGWWERPYQPLTHPYVLTRHWPEGKQWTDGDEYQVRQLTMDWLLLGLVRRCRKGIYLGISDLGEQGYEQRGPLLEVFQRMLRHAAQDDRGERDA